MWVCLLNQRKKIKKFQYFVSVQIKRVLCLNASLSSWKIVEYVKDLTQKGNIYFPRVNYLNQGLDENKLFNFVIAGKKYILIESKYDLTESSYFHMILPDLIKHIPQCILST